MIGDRRWTGSYGVDADVIARVNCSVLCVPAAEIQVCKRVTSQCIACRAVWESVCRSLQESLLLFIPT